MKIYNSPPSWPTPPEGWEPPPGWQPDPNWGPPPEGHQFWVEQPTPYFSGTEAPLRRTNTESGKGLSITALSLAVVALALCWVPIVNNFVFFLGLLAVGFAVPALIVTVRKRSTAKGMAVAASVIGVLSIVGVLATQSFYGSLFRSDAPSSRQVSPSTPNTLSTAEPGSTAGTARPVPLGTSASVGSDYEVTVKSVKLNATGEVLAANRFNDKPAGQFILVSLKVKYLGDGEGNPWIDLSETFVGSDARQYDASDCGAVVPDSVMDVPTLEYSGVATYQVCMDVPPAALKSGKLFIEKSISFRDSGRVYWAIQ